MTSRPVTIKSSRHRGNLLARLNKHSQPGLALSPGITALQDTINSDAFLRMNFTQAILEAEGQGYDLGFGSLDEFLLLLNATISEAVPFDETALVGCPVNALVDPLMNMTAGYAFFRSDKLNAALKVVLNEWCTFMNSPASRTYLNTTSPSGWFCPEAVTTTDLSQFKCDPTKPYYGFASWNDYFTREFLPNARPVDDPTNNKVIVSACEASPYNIQSNVKYQDRFWMKAQAYSLVDIFTPRYYPIAQNFVGGDIYQAFLSADNYHRWNAPVAGTVRLFYNVDGTYYSDTEFAGFDPAGPNLSQGYITATASRAVIIIDCADPAIGMVACVFVGMAEISSNIVTVKKGTVLKKGDPLGYFQYGGSTHCVIFQPGVIKEFVARAPFDMNAPPVHVGKTIAYAN
jgi:phosphatidylserine decarboxylase